MAAPMDWGRGQITAAVIAGATEMIHGKVIRIHKQDPFLPTHQRLAGRQRCCRYLVEAQSVCVSCEEYLTYILDPYSTWAKVLL